MEILILCNQKDCIHNKYGAMQFICNHTCPQIVKRGGMRTCTTKEGTTTDTNKFKVPDSWEPEEKPTGAPFDENLSADEYKGCSSGNCDPTRKSFTEYGDNDDTPIPQSIVKVIEDESELQYYF